MVEAIVIAAVSTLDPWKGEMMTWNVKKLLVVSLVSLTSSSPVWAFFPPIIPQNTVTTQPAPTAPITTPPPAVIVVPPVQPPQIPVTPPVVVPDPVTPNAVPEPASLISGLLGLGVTGLLARRRARKNVR